MIFRLLRRCMHDSKVLDVGCGHMPTGDVNCDRHPEPTVHRMTDIPVRRVKNFVKCDAEHLPFREDVFEEVHCFHTLEHLPNPVQGLLELLRVSSERVVVRVPYRNNIPERFLQFVKKPFRRKKRSSHLWSFTKTWFVRFGQRYRVVVDVKYSDFFIIPTEVGATFFK